MKSALVWVATLFLQLAFSTVHAQAQPSGVLARNAPLDASWPGSTPELFAPGVVNTDGVEINLIFDLDYTELFLEYARNGNVGAEDTAHSWDKEITHPFASCLTSR